MPEGDALFRAWVHSFKVHNNDEKVNVFNYLLNEEPNCLIHQVLQAQIRNPSKNYFIVDVESTLDELDIHLSKEDIKSCSK